MRRITIQHVLDATGLTYRQLDYHLRVRGERRMHRGSGHARDFTYRDVVELALLKVVLDSRGNSPWSADDLLIKRFRAVKHLDAKYLLLALSDGLLRTVDHDDGLVRVLNNNKMPLVVIALDSIVVRVNDALGMAA